MVNILSLSLSLCVPPLCLAECRQSVVSGDGLAKLVSFLGNKDYSDLHVLGVSVLSLCLEDAQSMVALQSSGCLQQLLTHISESNSPDMKRHAANALAKAAKNCESVGIILVVMLYSGPGELLQLLRPWPEQCFESQEIE